MNKELRKEHYKQNRDVLLDYQKARWEKLKTIFEKWKTTLKCSQCDESDYACLEFHHVDPKLKEKNIKKMVAQSLNSAIRELKKCIVVCANCHSKIHFYKTIVEIDESLSSDLEKFVEKCSKE